ncbi:MAG: hypothetical protein AB4038_19390, partial [Prochloraceae cyanobacterium]
MGSYFYALPPFSLQKSISKSLERSIFACRRLSRMGMVGERNVTVLLARMYADQMIAAQEKTVADNLPEKIPDPFGEFKIQNSKFKMKMQLILNCLIKDTSP